MKSARYGLIPLILVLIALLSPSVRSENDSDTALQTRNFGDIIIESGSLEWDMKEKTMVFDGGVVAQGEDLTIECDRVFVYLNEGSSENGSEDPDRIERIVAKGKVKIIRPDGEGMAEEAVYDVIEQKVDLIGQPAVFKRGSDSLTGSKITLFKDKEYVKVEGPVKAVLHPKSEEGALSSGQ